MAGYYDPDNAGALTVESITSDQAKTLVNNGDEWIFLPKTTSLAMQP